MMTLIPRPKFISIKRLLSGIEQSLRQVNPGVVGPAG